MSVAWGNLSTEAQEAMGWAAAMESMNVGTRAVLIGIIRVGQGNSDPELLLRVFGCPKERLFDALQRVAPHPTIRPHVNRPALLDALPKLSPNCKQALERAHAIREARHQPLITPPHFFAAIFDFPRSTAYRALREVMDVDLREVSQLYLEYLRDPRDDSFRDRLLRRYPDRIEKVEIKALDARGPIRALCFASNTDELAIAGQDGVQIIPLLEQSSPITLPSSVSEDWTAIAYSADGEYLAAGASKGALALWQRSRTWTLLWAFTGRGPAVRAIAFSPDGSMAVGNSSGDLVIHKPQSEPPGRMLHRLDNAGFVALTFSSDGRSLVSSDDGGQISLLDPSSGEKLATHAFQDGDVLAVAFQPDDLAILYVREDGSVGVWEPKAEQIRALTWEPGGGGATAAAVTGGEVALAVSAHGDDAIRLSPLGDRSSKARLLGYHLAPVISVGLSGDGKWVAAGGEDGRLQLWQPDAHPREAGVNWQLDSPLHAVERDELGRRQLARSIATRLRQVSDNGPAESFLLHVDGPWGVGKSTILEFLATELVADPADYLVVKFDAWRQSRVGPPWWALLTSLRSALRESLDRPGRIRLRTAEILHQLREAWLSNVISLFILLLALAAFVFVGPSDGDLGRGIQLLTGTIAVSSSVWVLGSTAARSLLWESAAGARLYEQSHQNPMESLALHFSWLMSKTNQRVVFFLDDVDRCDEKYVVDLLDSVQTLVRDAPTAASGTGEKPPYFVVAADGRWIRCSYESVYCTFDEAVHEPGRPLGYLFLDKIFQLTVRIPILGQEQRRAYLDHLLQKEAPASGAQHPELSERQREIRESRSQSEILSVVEAAPPASQPALRAAAAEQLATSEVVEQTEHELQKFSDLLEPNPRSMKRFVNAYSVALSTALLEERTLDPDHVALWVIARMRWPQVTDYLSRHPEAVNALQTPGEDPKRPLPEEIAPLVGDPAVVEVLSFGQRPLSESEIRALCGSLDLTSGG